MKALSLLALSVAQSGVCTSLNRRPRAGPTGRQLLLEGHDEGIYICLGRQAGRSILDPNSHNSNHPTNIYYVINKEQ
jgi:hypothetical protein